MVEKGLAVRIKFCGLTRKGDVEAAAAAGAAYVGFVFFPRSSRNLGHDQARELAALVPPGTSRVSLLVDPTDDDLGDAIRAVSPDLLQLHGSETPERVEQVRHLTGLPVMKAVGLRDSRDLPRLGAYERVADQLLVDAKPPVGVKVPGGNGLAFDWRLIAGRNWTIPWMLAGGLTSGNVGEAIRLTGATQVDVSTGVEEAPGLKDPVKIGEFAAAVEEAGYGTDNR